LPTPNNAGRKNDIPIALMKIRPRLVVAISLSASQPPSSTPRIEAIWT